MKEATEDQITNLYITTASSVIAALEAKMPEDVYYAYTREVWKSVTTASSMDKLKEELAKFIEEELLQ